MVHCILAHYMITLGIKVLHYIHEKSSHFSLFDDVCFIRIRQKLKKV